MTDTELRRYRQISDAKPNYEANDEQLLRWPFRLGTSYEVALFHSSF
jgi:hypothetical protein